MVSSSLIFDLGCHVGQDSDFYLKKGFTVVAVEASPTLCAQLKQRFPVEIAQNRFPLVEKAIAEQAHEVEFYVHSEESIRGTTIPEFGEHCEGRQVGENCCTVYHSIFYNREI
jgi:FkbM family methyltransferase